MASDWAAAVITRSSMGAYSVLSVKGPGDQASPPVPWSAQLTGTPSYAVADMFPNNLGIEIDAHSTGNGRIPAYPDGSLQYLVDQPNSWVGITVGLSKSSAGVQGGLFNGVANPGARLVSYYPKGNKSLEPFFKKVTLLETSRDQFGMASTNDELVALDYGLGVQAHNDPNLNSTVFPRRNKYYFSVTADYAATHATFSAPLDQVEIHGGHIYSMTYVEPTGWMGPVIEYHVSRLGFARLGTSGPWLGDVDALEVDPLDNQVLFSGTPDSVWDMERVPNEEHPSEIMLLTADQSPSHSNDVLAVLREAPVSTGSGAVGQRVTTKLGVIDHNVSNGSPDDVIVLCDFDPEGNGPDAMVGTPMSDRTGGLPSSGTMGISMMKISPPSRTATASVIVQVTGWGGKTPQFATVKLYEYMGAVAPNQNITSLTWNLVKTSTRNATDDAITFQHFVPSSYQNAPRSYFAKMTSPDGATLAISYASSIKL